MSIELMSLGSLSIRSIKVSLNLVRKKKMKKPFQVLYISDPHLSFWTNHVCEQIRSALMKQQLDVIVLGGDLVDSSFGLHQLEKLIKFLKTKAPVFALAGNHDHWVGINRVKKVAALGGAQWLSDQEVVFHHSSQKIVLSAMVQKTPKQNGYHILCTHDPSIFPSAVKQGYSLILAGHLHGGQIILWKNKEHLYPGAFLYKWNVLHHLQAKSDLYVSLGINDTLPIRYNCPREMLLCSIF